MVITDSGIGKIFQPLGNMVGGSLGGIARYAWVLIPLVLMLFIGGIIWIYIVYKKKGSQWTHKLEVRRVLDNETRLLSKPFIMKMRRFPLIKNAEVFELEKPLLGSYLFPDLDKYTGENEFSIVLDTNNRIFTNTGVYFNPDKNHLRNMTVFVSPRDQYGNVLPRFPDRHFFYLGSRVLGTELPYVSEAFSDETFKIIFKVNFFNGI